MEPTSAARAYLRRKLRIDLCLLALATLTFAAVVVLVSYARWHGAHFPRRLTPDVLVPTERERQFGPGAGGALGEVTPAWLDRPLPNGLHLQGPLGRELERLSTAANVEIRVEWKTFEVRTGLTQDSPVNLDVSAVPFSDALLRLRAHLPGRSAPNFVVVQGEFPLLRMTGLSLSEILPQTTMMFDLSDLLAPAPSALFSRPADIQSQLAVRFPALTPLPQSTSPPPEVAPNSKPSSGPMRRRNATSDRPAFQPIPAMRWLEPGTLIVTTDPITLADAMAQIDTWHYDVQWWRRFPALVSSLLWSLAMVVPLFIAIGSMLTFWRHRRRGLPKGLCLICGFDLRATPDRCPECGTPCGEFVATSPSKIG